MIYPAIMNGKLLTKDQYENIVLKKEQDRIRNEYGHALRSAEESDYKDCITHLW